MWIYEEDDRHTDEVWSKQNPYINAKKLALNFPYGTIAYNQYCNNDVEKAKEVSA